MLTRGFTVLSLASQQHDCDCPPHPDLAPFDAQWLAAHHCDDHLVLLADGLQIARCSLWWHETAKAGQGTANQRAANQRAASQEAVGLVGHYAAVDEAAGVALLEAAVRQLAGHGCTRVIGPLDENTWRDYRLPVEGDDTPAFLFEPYVGNCRPESFQRGGFRPIAWYFSARVDDLTVRHRRVERARTALHAGGVRIRDLRADQLEQELRDIYAIATAAFRDNPWYAPLTEESFLDMYQSLGPRVPLDYTCIAARRGRPVGFCFAVPDLLQASRGERVDTVVIKTLAVAQDRDLAGLGQVLLEEVQHRSAEMGMRRAIHALVRETPSLQRISRRYGTPFRRYALFGQDVRP